MSGGVITSASFTVGTAATLGSYAIIRLTGSLGDFATATFALTGGQTGVSVVFQESGLGPDAVGNVILIDSVWYTYDQLAAGVTLSWVVGSTHTVSANTLISGMNGNQYYFEDWSDDGASTHSITVNGATDYVAYYSPTPSYGYEVATTTQTVTATSYSTVTQTSEVTSTTTSIPVPMTVTTSATVTTTTTTTDTTAEMIYGSLMAVFLALFLATLVLLVGSRSRGSKRAI
jgi:hypothetical protein